MPIKIYMTFFTEIKKKLAKIHMEAQKTPDSQSNAEQKAASQRDHHARFRAMLQSYGIRTKTVQRWHRNRYADRRNKTEDPNMSTHNHSHLIVDKDTKNTHGREGSIFNKWCCGNWMLTYRRVKSDPYLESCPETNSKWSEDRGVKLEMLELRAET